MVIDYFLLLKFIHSIHSARWESDLEQSDEYRPSDISDKVGSEDDSDEDYSSLAEDESESGENRR